MAKLKLEMESLKVETFETVRDESKKGTVLGFDYTSGPLECMDACYSAGCSNFECPSEMCSGFYCQSLSGCESYENTCFCETHETC